MRANPGAWEQFCGEIDRLRRAGHLSEAQLEQLGQEGERLYEAGRLSDDQALQLATALLSDEDNAFIDALAFGIARLVNTPLGQLAAEAGVSPRNRDLMTGDELSRTLGFHAGQLADTPIDQLAAEAREHRRARSLLDAPGHAGHGIVLQNPHDHPTRWYSAYQVDWLRGYPVPPLPVMIDGYPVVVNVVDSLPVPY